MDAERELKEGRRMSASGGRKMEGFSVSVEGARA